MAPYISQTGIPAPLLLGRQGVKKIPCVYDNDEIVTCALGEIQYKADITWCRRFGIKRIGDLKNRILAPDAYEELWRGRCGKMYDLEAALLAGTVNRKRFTRLSRDLCEQGLFIYGISTDLQTIYYENIWGALFEEPFRHF